MPSSPCAARNSADAMRTSGSAATAGLPRDSIPQIRRAPAKKLSFVSRQGERSGALRKHGSTVRPRQPEGQRVGCRIYWVDRPLESKKKALADAAELSEKERENVCAPYDRLKWPWRGCSQE